MRGCRALFGLALVAIVQLVAGETKFPEENDVIVLSDENFDAAITEHNLIMVEFYAPWCGHCKKLEPDYAKAAAALKKNDPPIAIAKLDATEHKKASEKFQIRGFPTIKVFKGGNAIDYQGGRSADELVEFMVKKAGPPAVTLTSEADAKAFLEKNPTAAIAFFSSLTGPGATKFLEFANKDDRFALAYTDSAAVLKKYSAKADTLKFITADGNYDLPLTWDTLTDDDLSTWLFGHSIPVLQTYEQSKNRLIFGGPINVHVLAFLDAKSKDFESVSKEIKAAGAKYRTKALIIHMPTTEDRILAAFDLKAEDAPKVVLADLRGGAMKKFFLDGPIKTAAVDKFITSFLAGELKPVLKSEEPSAEDTAGPVTVLKGKSFKDLVLDNDKDVLVEFYAPWCGHCKSLAPKYEELGKKFKGVDSVTIAKMDATANEIEAEGVNVRGFPTILLFPGNNKNAPISYEGAREVPAFVSFLKEHATKPFSLDDDDEEETVDDAKDEL